MLIQLGAGEAAGVSLSIREQDFESLLDREWLLTNGRGSYASSTVAGCNTRGYHGLLIGSLRPPVNRIMALSACLETVLSGQEAFTLSSFEFADKLAPASAGSLKRFRRDIGAHFDYELKKINLTKSAYLVRDMDMVAIVYNFTRVQGPVEFVTRPLVGLRDFHSLQRSGAPLRSSPWHGLPARGTPGQPCPEPFDLAQGKLRRRDGHATTGVLVRYTQHLFDSASEADDPSDVDALSKQTFAEQPRQISAGPDGCSLLLRCPSAPFQEDPQWWFNFMYRAERERGLSFTEDLWTPGFFKCRIDAPTKIVLWASLHAYNPGNESDKMTHIDIDTICEDLREHQENLFDSRRRMPDARSTGHALPARENTPKMGVSQSTIKNRVWKMLCLAADQFVAKRQVNDSRTTTILAGYHWFADWGRDALIALPGLLLATGRFDQAKSVLTTFAAAADEGMIPNRFDDNSDTTYFNSVDASLWFINAVFQYLEATGDSKTFGQELLPVVRWIIESYHKGTRFGIHADADGLITAGNEQTQLTWMDAKYGGVAFTPRHGKAVEVNALWYNALMQMKNLELRMENSKFSIPNSQFYSSMAAKVQAAFCELFWNEGKGYLNDCILPACPERGRRNGSVDERLRPNQIFAVSLNFSPLSARQQVAVVAAVQSKLLTPYGLRTLSPDAPGYKGQYSGPPRQRDDAYHQGTVWPYLIGPFVEAYLKVNEFSPSSRKQAAEFIEPLLAHLTEDACIGSISEIFGGDPPHKPKGCIAQAWSVAELIRAYQLINSP